MAAEAPKVREEKKDEAKPEPKAEPKAPTLVAESAEFKAKVAQLPTATPAAKRASSFGAQHKTNPNRPTVGEIAQGIEAGVNNVKERLGRFTKQLGMKKRKK